MTILTIGASPNLLSRAGKINADILIHLKSLGHSVSTVAWHHDISYFLANEIGQHVFHGPNGAVCPIHPFLGEQGSLAAFTYSVMKALQPDVVITVGQPYETEFMFSIRSMYPCFKWLALLITGNEVTENQREYFQLADMLVASTDRARVSIKDRWNLEAQHIPYGVDLDVFRPMDKQPELFSVFSCGKNIQMSNLPAFMLAVRDSGVNGTLHTNMYDDGDNDLLLLQKRFAIDNLELPKRYLSVREGFSDDEMNHLFNGQHCVVDVSMQSSTGLALLEAMATGCVPVGINFGAIGEIISQMPQECRFFAPHNIFIGPRHEEYAVVSQKDLSSVILNIKEQYRGDREVYRNWRKKSMEIAKLFSKESFLFRINECIERIVYYEQCLPVDIY